MGGSVVFILGHYWRRLTGRFGGRNKMRRTPITPAGGDGAMGPMPGGGGHVGSVKSFYSSDPPGSELEIAIQPGSARFAGGQMHVPPHSEQQLSDDGTYTPRSDGGSPLPPVRRRRESPTFRE